MGLVQPVKPAAPTLRVTALRNWNSVSCLLRQQGGDGGGKFLDGLFLSGLAHTDGVEQGGNGDLESVLLGQEKLGLKIGGGILRAVKDRGDRLVLGALVIIVGGGGVIGVLPGSLIVQVDIDEF